MCLIFDSPTPPWSPSISVRNVAQQAQTGKQPASFKLIPTAHTATYTVTHTTTHCGTHEAIRTLSYLNQFNYHIIREFLGSEALQRPRVLPASCPWPMGATHPPPVYDGISDLQTTLFTVGHHGAAADCIPGMIIQLSTDDSRDAWTWFAGDLSACDASARLRPVATPRHGLVDTFCLVTIATQVTVARQARIKSGHSEGSRSFGAFLGPHSD